MTRFCTYAITIRDANPLMGCTAVSVLKHDEIFARMQLLTEILNPLVGSTAVAVFKHDEIMHLCNYYLRFESTYGLNYSRCFQKCRVFARVQLLSEIRIHLWVLLQSLF
ncbi:hypothetical protein CEXT_343151 [Caerostris extrusa]|uniref:Uncharacterized protein n=1 Tax=Caerostris extrusa TaxID=172846 RepID=A0AAV4U7T8_CAEEX|nr:hypothetical protein CEXT_343151 [Caerostris extrusa]